MDCKNEMLILIKNFKNNLTYYKSNKYNESACRLEFIDKFFTCLGWDVNNSMGKEPTLREVIVENHIAETGRPDYAMTLNGISKFFVEAKKPSVDILKDGKSIFQAKSYGWSAKHNITILTNFETLLIYDTTIKPYYDDTPAKALLHTFTFMNYETDFDVLLSLISKEALYSGVFETTFKTPQNSKQQVDEVFLEQINLWRIKLGQFLYEKSFSLDIINDIVQDFINQIIFLRICEDRNLPTYRKLIDTISDENKIQDEIYKLIKQADKTYNSGLFKDNKIALDLNNQIIKEIIETLYYPESPYVFNLISSSILGQIYEMYLVKYLDIDDLGNIFLKNKKHNVNRSIVSTPPEIAKYMTNKAINLAIEGKTPTEVKRLKFSDISCGSGIFLTEMYQKINEHCVKWYMKNEPDKILDLGQGRYKLSIHEKKDILLNCIYGIDIDTHAVEVAKFSLLLKLLEDETSPTIQLEIPVLPDLSINVLCGNSLIDFNMYQKHAVESDLIELFPFDWKDENNKELTFDVIIGNPPYVKTEDMVNLLPKSELVIYKKYYKSSFQQFDKYFIFIERALEKLKDSGVLCFIVPNKFTKIKSGKNLRLIISKSQSLKEFIDFGANQLFKEQTIYSSILLLKKDKQEYFTFREVIDIDKWYLTYDTNTPFVDISNKVIDENPWILTTDKDLIILINKVFDNSTPLKKIATPFNGVQTSAEQPAIYWFGEDEIIKETEKYFEIKKFGVNYKIEKSILKPYFKPIKKNERKQYSFDILKTDKWIIFPYINGSLISLETLKEEYPQTLLYLKDRYNNLIPRQLSQNGKGRDVPMATDDTWFQFGRDQALNCFDSTKKLIVGVMGKGLPMYMLDKNDFVISSGGTAGYCAIKEKEDSKYCLEFIQAYLSHPVIEKIISIIGSDFEGGFYSRGTSVLDIIPIKNLDFENEHHKMLYEEVVSMVKNIHLINDNLKKHLSKKEEILNVRKKEILIKEINKILDIVLAL